MKKLTFRYSSMNAGKSRNLIGTYYNYKELGLNSLVVLPDIIASKKVISRDGQELNAISFIELLLGFNFDNIDCILVDEVHMLSKKEIDVLNEITIGFDIPVICYGLRTDFRGITFEGSNYLLGIADSLEELPTLCGCGRKARMNLRLISGEVDKSTDSTLKLREEEDVSYISMCRECYYNAMNGHKSIKDMNIFDNTKSIKNTILK